MLLKTISQTNSNSIYSDAITGISNLVTWIESQSVTPSPDDQIYTDATNAFTNLKNDSIKWYNSIYPSCIQVLDSIQSMNTPVSDSITTLVSISDQLLSQPDNQQLHDAIVNNATQIMNQVSGLQNQSNNLENSFSQFSQSLAKDFSDISTSHNNLLNDMNIVQNQIYSLIGQLNALESKPCPSQGDINACESQIDNKKMQYNRIQSLYYLLEQSVSYSSAATQGISYMLSFWNEIDDGVSNVLSALSKVINDPAIVIKLDLNYSSQAWANLQNFVLQTLQQLPQNLKSY